MHSCLQSLLVWGTRTLTLCHRAGDHPSSIPKVSHVWSDPSYYDAYCPPVCQSRHVICYLLWNPTDCFGVYRSM
jgi:hypothetical protein